MISGPIDLPNIWNAPPKFELAHVDGAAREALNTPLLGVTYDPVLVTGSSGVNVFGVVPVRVSAGERSHLS